MSAAINLNAAPSPVISTPPQPPPATPVRIRQISICDFRGFPAGEPYRFVLEDGKNLLLHGENGAGKSSLFHGLKLLLSPTKPSRAFGEFEHIYPPELPAGTTRAPGLLAIDLTAGNPQDYVWDAARPHPSESVGDVTFKEIARRATFLDYKSLLRTSLPHEEKDHINVFQLVIGTLLADAEFPDNKTVAQHWQSLGSFQPKSPPLRQPDETETDYADVLKDWPSPETQIEQETQSFTEILGKMLERKDAKGNPVGIVPRANRYLSEHLQPHLQIRLELKELKPTRIGPPHEFGDADLALTAVYAKKQIDHPSVFLNEARLSAIALALYLASAAETSPASIHAIGFASNLLALPRILALDDALIGLDLAHRLPLLDILLSDDFRDWQIILLTFDSTWFEMASDYLSKDTWVKLRLHAELHPQGWEIPVLEADASHLDRAWNHIQGGDYKAAGVYLRTAWENTMRTFCEAHHELKVPLRHSTHEYKAEEFWNLVKKYESKQKHRLVDDALAGEITICRGYVLNPLCHNDPARPTREEF